MSHTIVTMSRGDALRIIDWLRYHVNLGFDRFHIILDAPIDDTERLIAQLDLPAEITTDVRPPSGEYYDGMSPAARWARVKEWRIERADEIRALGLPASDALAMRQYLYFPDVLAQFQGPGDGWVALIDVDEYIAISADRKITDLTSAASQPRLRFLNFNVSMEGWNPGMPVWKQTMRWARRDIQAYGKGWQSRVKSIVRNDSLLPLSSVHPISVGPFELVDESVARLLHYRFPDQGIQEIPYTVHDTDVRDRWTSAFG